MFSVIKFNLHKWWAVAYQRLLDEVGPSHPMKNEGLATGGTRWDRQAPFFMEWDRPTLLAV